MHTPRVSSRTVRGSIKDRLSGSPCVRTAASTARRTAAVAVPGVCVCVCVEV